MRKLFPGYYRPSDSEFSALWNNSLFVLDANVLLNLYAYSSETKEELINILKTISDRIWIPYQAAFEYQRRRLDVIQQQITAYDNIKEALKNARNKLGEEIRSALRQGKHQLIDLGNLLGKIEEFFPALENELDDLKNKHPDFFTDDQIRENLTSILGNKVGTPYSEEKLKEIYEEGQKRYSQKIPPGYEDARKDDTSQYGDLILWYQIIDKAKEKKNPIILVTDDTKEDWWWKFKGKAVGPRPELIHEIRAKCDVSFYMYRSGQFMEHAREYLRQIVAQKAIQEVKDVTQKIAQEGLDSYLNLSLVKSLIKREEKEALKKLIDSIAAADIADLLEHLDSAGRLYIFKLLEPEIRT